MGRNLIGEVHGRLTIVRDFGYVEVLSKNGNYYKKRKVFARCSCNGNVKEYNYANLYPNGYIKSCGCLLSELRASHINNRKGITNKSHTIKLGTKEDASYYSISKQSGHTNLRVTLSTKGKLSYIYGHTHHELVKRQYEHYKQYPEITLKFYLLGKSISEEKFVKLFIDT